MLGSCFFPFEIVSDIPIGVANEMVKELEITDWKPSEIADITGLVPNWKSDHSRLTYIVDSKWSLASSWTYYSADEHDPVMSPRRHSPYAIENTSASSRFYHGENSGTRQYLAKICYKQCKDVLDC
ncbi:unnamed protein product [Fraxinus pennsylvanica]|uniref:Uncharacterized protein n=1 Tax=Fraxinus pennsylvanica TaxID=56036 RepID=A0AAD1ZVN5_9LAMI|nr:unnamed protein product [Fraxinus pennsylvanica]